MNGRSHLAVAGRLATVLALVVAPLVGTGGRHASADDASGSVTPSQWASSSGLSLALEGWPNALRYAGADRYETNLAITLGLRGKGDYPFDTPDRSSGGATSLSAANDWWGAGVCPRSIIVVAGRSPADAMAASALSDPTGHSSEPYLQRSAAADPLFDPVGGFARVDTDSAPILVTSAASNGASALATPARLAAQDMKRGGCAVARQAIIVGGTAAVPADVEAELLSIGYDEVFRIAGTTRYDTAAKVAQSLGTAALPAGATHCADPTADDGASRMTFVVNAAVEHRASAGSCELLGRTVVLADGVTGADALAAGWWTSFWQVPVLLHNGSGILPVETAAALSTMDIDHIIILGGTSRITDSVAAAAASLAGADVIRIAGADRYETSVDMAQQLGGWWPTGRADEFQGSMVCLAASAGTDAAATGWPDALSAGPFCGALNGAAANPGAPTRALVPVDGQAPLLTSGAPPRPAHDAVPVLLVPTGAATLPASVANLLQAAFAPADSWCTSVAAPTGCAMPGFAIGFGGSAVLSANAIAQASSLVSGGSAPAAQPGVPTLRAPFLTGLDMTPVFSTTSPANDRVCMSRGAATAARWLSVFDDPGASHPVASSDVMVGGGYLRDGDAVVRSRGTLAPTCVAFDPGSLAWVTARAVSIEGRASPISTFALNLLSRFSLSAPLLASSPATSSGASSDVDGSLSGVTAWTYLLPVPSTPTAVDSRGAISASTGGSLSLELTRGANTSSQTGPDSFTATWSIATALGAVTGTAVGEGILTGSVWQLRGQATFTGGSWNIATGSGGFSVTLDTKAAGNPSDDAVSFTVDGLVIG